MSTHEAIDVAQLIAAAQSATGLADFGDPSLMPALARMTQALNEEARLSAIGIEARRQSLVRLLINRLKLAERLSHQPGVAQAAIGTPIVVVGLPRSGTTKLQRLIASDPGLNHLAFWEALFPIALSDGPDDLQYRIGGGEAFCNALRANPEFYAAHPVAAQEPEEEMVVMQHSLLTESIDAEVRVPSYVHWLQTQDRQPMYRQLAQWLRVLAADHAKPGKPWILKGTYHGAYLDALLDEIPNACIVYLHRDPVATIASYCSLVSKIRAMLSDRVDKVDLGNELLAYWSAHLRQTLDVRNRLPANSVLDVSYHDLLDDAQGVVERVYDFAGLSLDSDARTAMAGWEHDNSQHKHGRHDYRAEDFGLSDARIAEVCAGYRFAFIER